jgi:hypothetical protein
MGIKLADKNQTVTKPRVQQSANGKRKPQPATNARTANPKRRQSNDSNRPDNFGNR